MASSSSSASASPIHTPASKCQTCNNNDSKYTCPRCHLRTCSLACSTAHKKTTGCSGVRDKAAFVPMSQYGWGRMMDDYVFLEDVGRKVGEWGGEISKGGYADENRDSGRKGKEPMSKRDLLQMELSQRFGIEMDLLPLGMERRKVNQSTWDFKNQTAYLTIEFKFHSSGTVTSTLFTHRNDINSSPVTILLHTKANRQKVPSWLSSSEPRMPSADWTPSWQCTIPAPPSLVAPPSKGTGLTTTGIFSRPNQKRTRKPEYHLLDPKKPLAQILKDQSFVEYPTIEIWEDGLPDDSRRQPSKKRKAAGGGLGDLGAYGSDDED